VVRFEALPMLPQKIKGLLARKNPAATCLLSFWNKDYQLTIDLALQSHSDVMRLEERLSWDSPAWISGDLIYAFHSSRMLGKPQSRFIADSLIPSPFTSQEQLCNFIKPSLRQFQSSLGGTLLSQPPFPTIAIAAIAGLRHGVDNLVETGTYLGTSSLMVSSLFEEVYTVEADPLIAETAKLLHQSACVGNVHVHIGNSPQFLRSLDKTTMAKSVVYLDAHFSGGPTTRRYGETPLMDELDSVLGLAPVICIDDMRCCGQPGYPSLADVFNRVPACYSSSLVCDQLVLVLRDQLTDVL